GRESSVWANFDSLGRKIASPSSVLKNVNFLAGWCDLEPEPLRILVPQELVRAGWHERINRSFGDLAAHARCLSEILLQQSYSNHQKSHNQKRAEAKKLRIAHVTDIFDSNGKVRKHAESWNVRLRIWGSGVRIPPSAPIKPGISRELVPPVMRPQKCAGDTPGTQNAF